MPRNYIFFQSAFFLFLFMIGCSVLQTKTKLTPAEVIESHYKEFLERASYDQDAKLELPYSKSFSILLKDNQEACGTYAGTKLCGWNAEADTDLDSRPTDPRLDFAASGFNAKEISPGVVEAKYNTTASRKRKKGDFDRSIRFKMILERGNWVIDDVLEHGQSARQQIQDETQNFSPR